MIELVKERLAELEGKMFKLLREEDLCGNKLKFKQIKIAIKSTREAFDYNKELLSALEARFGRE